MIPYPLVFVNQDICSTMQRFGEKLRTLRKRSRMTQHDLAARLGFASQGYIHFLESGKKLPNAVLIVKIADLFQVTTDQLLRDELELDTEAGSQPYSDDQS